MSHDGLQIFGGLVWILVACTLVVPANPQAWVMFVSIFCFVMTFIWMVSFACGAHHHHSGWATAVRQSVCLSFCLPVCALVNLSSYCLFSGRTSCITPWLPSSTSVLRCLWLKSPWT